MAVDPRFYATSGARRLDVIAAAAGTKVAAEQAARLFIGAAPLDTAGPDDISFLEGRRSLDAARASRAGAILVSPGQAGNLAAADGVVTLPCDRPSLAFARVAALFHAPIPGHYGIHHTASVSASAKLGEGCDVGPFAVIGDGAVLGRGCRLGPHAVVGPGCVFGEACHLHAHASAYFTLAGDRVVLHAGARIGGEGFGFVPDARGDYVTMPQLGRVILGDAVEVGANACIDRGSAGDTVVGPGTRIDNLVMLGHNVRTGAGCILVAQVGISGSSVLGDRVQAAGQAGVAGHLKIGSGTRVGAQSGVLNDLPAGQDVFGTPARPIREAMRGIVTLRRLAARGSGRDT